MSITDQNSPARSAEHDLAAPADGKPEKKGVDLSLTQIVGGALAAMTAAAIGSTLSVAGTVIGAALASVVAAVAGALYTASLRHTRAKVRTVFRYPMTADSAAAGDADGSTPIEVDVVPNADASIGAPESAGSTALLAAAAAPGPEGAPGHTPRTVRPTGRTTPRRGVQWKGAVVGALAAFGIAGVVLTGFELVTGHSLSGGTGTTVEQVSQPKQVTRKPAPSQTPSAPASSQSAEPSQSPTPSATETQPSANPSDAPSQAPSGSSTGSTPTAAPTTGAPSSVPSGSSTAVPTTGANTETAPPLH